MSEVDGEPEEEDKPDYGGSIPLDTNDLGIPVEHEPERNNFTSDWRTMASLSLGLSQTLLTATTAPMHQGLLAVAGTGSVGPLRPPKM